MRSLGPTELIVVLGGLLPLGLVIWALVDAVRRAEADFVAAGQSRTLWIVLLAIGLFVCGPGAILALVYLLIVRPKLAGAPTL